jgi:hypothetical protein
MRNANLESACSRRMEDPLVQRICVSTEHLREDGITCGGQLGNITHQDRRAVLDNAFGYRNWNGRGSRRAAVRPTAGQRRQVCFSRRCRVMESGRCPRVTIQIVAARRLGRTWHAHHSQYEKANAQQQEATAQASHTQSHNVTGVWRNPSALTLRPKLARHPRMYGSCTRHSLQCSWRRERRKTDRWQPKTNRTKGT